ncbi:MAG: VanW family protein [bacterium]|nr:VanW family protein [bacterium]
MKKKIKIRGRLFFFLTGIFLGIFFLTTSFYFLWEKRYTSKIYPGLYIAGYNFGGKTPREIEDYFRQKNSRIKLDFTFAYKDLVATQSAAEINWGYNEKLIADQALSFGRTNNSLSDLYQKINALKNGYSLPVSYSYNEQTLSSFLKKMAEKIDIPAKEALFHFSNGRVSAFQLSSNGQALDTEETKKIISSMFSVVPMENSPLSLSINLPVRVVEPEVTTGEANNLGVKELVAQGSSHFAGSIPNRAYNVQLAASRLNGILVPPDKEFSFNKSLGDVSKLTGYKEAYVIKEGRTILGDGGGVCQVSTTLFRAVLNAGLPITERHAHSYRVGYYEQDSPPGLDASVYDPQWDLKFTNNTGGYLLIQSSVDPKTSTLVFELYGTSDGRITTISKPVVKNQVPPPEDLYQDDPNLPKGEVKQIDWKAWGADASFTQTVERNGETLISETFSSHYQPWQAVFLKGTKE